MYFEDLPLSEDILDALYDMRFETCSPIQEKCIPHLLEGKDLVGIAQTGTGKTAAYLLPVLTLLQNEEHPQDAVNCLVMAPTRELARQIEQALQGFAYYMNISCAAIYGGNDGIRYEQERKSLQQGADIVIATPGRLIAHLQLGTLDLSRTTHFILDEADRMLDMGFAEDIQTIIKQLPAERQTILFSATMPDKIRQLVKSITRLPVEVNIAISKPADTIDQSVYICQAADKLKIVASLFKDAKPERVIIFSSSKQKVKELYQSLERMKFNVAQMHSDLTQPERDRTMQQFKARQIDMLIATDIVARGIDIDDITMVVNFDTPRDAEEYIHRIGRAGRAGRTGKAVTLVSAEDYARLKAIEALLEKEVPRAQLPEGLLPPSPDSLKHKGGGGKFKAHPKGKSARKPARHKPKAKHREKPKKASNA
ncbi:MAG: DEAD/DEAH box helicase [Bacteroidaceae bacterium]|nr:DEAD/DEAH box helicase [Bacteroidaceae bacterium]